MKPFRNSAVGGWIVVLCTSSDYLFFRGPSILEVSGRLLSFKQESSRSTASSEVDLLEDQHRVSRKRKHRKHKKHVHQHDLESSRADINKHHDVHRVKNKKDVTSQHIIDQHHFSQVGGSSSNKNVDTTTSTSEKKVSVDEKKEHQAETSGSKSENSKEHRDGVRDEGKNTSQAVSAATSSAEEEVVAKETAIASAMSRALEEVRKKMEMQKKDVTTGIKKNENPTTSSHLVPNNKPAEGVDNAASKSIEVSQAAAILNGQEITHPASSSSGEKKEQLDATNAAHETSHEARQVESKTPAPSAAHQVVTKNVAVVAGRSSEETKRAFPFREGMQKKVKGSPISFSHPQLHSQKKNEQRGLRPARIISKIRSAMKKSHENQDEETSTFSNSLTDFFRNMMGRYPRSAPVVAAPAPARLVTKMNTGDHDSSRQHPEIGMHLSSKVANHSRKMKDGKNLTPEDEKKKSHDFKYIHSENEEYDLAWPALDAADADLVEDSNWDAGEWQALENYDRLRHQLVTEKEQVLKAKQTVDMHQTAAMISGDVLEKKDMEEQRLALNVEESTKQLEIAENELAAVSKETLEAKKDLEEKREVLDKMVEEKTKLIKEEEKLIALEQQKVENAENNYKAVKKMVEDTREFEAKEKAVEEKKVAHKKNVDLHAEALKVEEAAAKVHEKKMRALGKVKNMLRNQEKELADMKVEAANARTHLGEFRSTDQNPWTGKMGGVIQEPEVKPANAGLSRRELFMILLVPAVVALVLVTGKVLKDRYGA